MSRSAAIPLLPTASDPVTMTCGQAGRPATRRRTILDAIRRGAGTPAEIRAVTGLPLGVVRQAIEWLAVRGFVRPTRWEAT